jgi:hypothetical protein
MKGQVKLYSSRAISLIGFLCLGLVAFTLFRRATEVTPATGLIGKRPSAKAARQASTRASSGSLFRYHGNKGTLSFTDSSEAVPVPYRKNAKEIELPPITYLNFPREQPKQFPNSSYPEKKLSQKKSSSEKGSQSKNPISQSAGIFDQINGSLPE